MDGRENIKAIALDLDGTLVAADHHVSAENREAVRTAAKRGLTIILASGRPFAGIKRVAEEIGLAELGGYVVAANGGHVVDMGRKTELRKRHIPRELFGELAGFMGVWREAALLTYDDEAMLIEDAGNPYAARIAETLRVPVRRIKPFFASLNGPVTKLILAGEPRYLAAMAEPLKERFSERVKCVYGGESFIEIMPRGVTKAEGLSLLADRLKIRACELMCVGDSPNDLEMLDYAGFSVAMANAPEEIKRRADYVTAGCEENGVARAILEVIGYKMTGA